MAQIEVKVPVLSESVAEATLLSWHKKVGESVSRDLIVYADRDRFDFVRFEVSLAYTKGDEPPVLLTFETAPNGTLALKPDADCRADPQTCDRLKTTDFGTEFSLW